MQIVASSLHGPKYERAVLGLVLASNALQKSFAAAAAAADPSEIPSEASARVTTVDLRGCQFSLQVLMQFR